MADKVCKWCGNEFDSDSSGSTNNGWAVCSERCRLALDGSVKEGKSEARSSSSGCGCVVWLVLLVLAGGVISKCGSHASSRHSGHTAREATSTSSESGSNSVSADPDATTSKVTTETASDSQQASSSEPASSDESSSSEQALTMLRSTDPHYSTRAIMNATGLSRREIKRLRRQLKQDDD